MGAKAAAAWRTSNRPSTSLDLSGVVALRDLPVERIVGLELKVQKPERVTHHHANDYIRGSLAASQVEVPDTRH
jgi:hypothetical protein